MEEERPVSEDIRLQVTRFSAGYTPLIATIAGGFLREEGLEAVYFHKPPQATESRQWHAAA